MHLVSAQAISPRYRQLVQGQLCCEVDEHHSLGPGTVQKALHCQSSQWNPVKFCDCAVFYPKFCEVGRLHFQLNETLQYFCNILQWWHMRTMLKMMAHENYVEDCWTMVSTRNRKNNRSPHFAEMACYPRPRGYQTVRYMPSLSNANRLHHLYGQGAAWIENRGPSFGSFAKPGVGADSDIFPLLVVGISIRNVK